MISHPLTFLVGYVLVTFILSFVVVGPLVVFMSILFRRRVEKRYTDGLYLGASATAFAFMILHYLLYLRGYGMTKWSTLFGDIFYPSRYF
ncbi:MAG: hypothetical protein B6I25_06125 [Planctomycetales bacterium 4572_13]|nr:MAG: hypothetical protein B6I25_06125 [Planctomycetales bacterium 4572_13]